MITHVRIENFRSLKDTGWIQIKPVNILLGANSSGKSSFLRSFPLFLQSVTKELREPISWFDDSLVDFGDYKTSKNRYAADDEFIKFSYKIHGPYNAYSYYSFYDFGLSYMEYIQNSDEIELCIFYACDKEGTYVNKIEILWNENKYVLQISSRKDQVQAVVNNDLSFCSDWYWEQSTNRGMFPRSYIMPSNGKHVFFDRHMFDVTISTLKGYCSKRLTKEGRLKKVIFKCNGRKTEFLHYLQSECDISSLRTAAKSWNVDSKDFNVVYATIMIWKLLPMINILNQSLVNFYSCSSYIAPIRAEAFRSYRNQGLQINDIDAYGRNLNEFISSLRGKKKNDYDQYCKSILKYSFYVSGEAAQKSIFITNENGSFNLTDVGFGYSQVLPIITKLWQCIYSMNNSKRNMYRYTPVKNLITIEQPELHLHPAMQASVADAIIEATKKAKGQDDERLRFIVETHSQALLNRIGRRIREGRISADDVNIIMFNKDFGMKNTEVQQISFNDQGQLEKWPYGFFDPKD